MDLGLRAVMFAAAILLIIPEGYTDAAGLALGLAIWGWQRYRHGPSPGDKIPAPVPDVR